MASVSAPTFPSRSRYKDTNHRKSPLRNPNLHSSTSLHSPTAKKFRVINLPIFSSAYRVSNSVACRCHNQSDSSSPLEENVGRGWNSQFQDVVKSVIGRIEEYLNSKKGSDVSIVKSEEKENKKEEVKEVEDWDWERWKKHFQEVDEQEKLVSILKSQLGNAVYGEEYEYASKLKVAMAAAATNDVVGGVVSRFNTAIAEERYQDAAFLRDYAGTGLMGWWAGISDDSEDPYGRIIHIGVEHGRYVARTFSPRHLATATPGVPLFEIFLTLGSKGEYKQQAVYLKRNGGKLESSTHSSKSLDHSSRVRQLNESNDVKNGRSPTSTEDIEDKDDDSDVAEGLAGVQNLLRDINPDAKVRILEVTAPEKVDKDFIFNVIEQILEEEDDDEEEEEEEEKDVELVSLDSDDDNDAKAEGHRGTEESETDVEDGNGDSDSDTGDDLTEMEIKVEIDDGDGFSSGDNGSERSDMEIKVVIGGNVQTLSNKAHAKSLLRVPAKLKKKDRLSFSFSVEEDEKERKVGSKEHAKLQGHRSIVNVMSDLAKFATNREKIPMKVLKDVEDFISLTLNQAKNRQPLSGTTTFNRIEIPESSDLLNGLYVGAHGLYTSEVIHLSRKYGQWQEDGVYQKHSNLDFYEYVEALKLTGDPYVPAGQVAFRAKVGKQYQLPHKGIIPEEFGVVARYKGQGRLAEPGFKNPRWVDGELVILDGKYIKGGPVVGFVYWAPDYHFLVFFNRLRLPE